MTRAVLIDLDGTLIDTAPDLAAAVNATLAELQCAALQIEQLRSFIGEGVAVLVRRSLGARMSAGEVDAKLAPALEHFERHYASTNGRYSSLYPGVAEGLRAMRGLGLRIGCVTNKPLRFAEPLLAHFALLELLDTLVAGDSTSAKKPDPAPLLEACRRLGVPPQACILIGDSAHDAHAARAAGMPFVAVPYGYGGKEALRDAPSAASLAQAAEFLAAGRSYSGWQ
jgi:phosphoglycolate phosphatase